jgi:predicted phosphatase
MKLPLSIMERGKVKTHFAFIWRTIGEVRALKKKISLQSFMQASRTFNRYLKI